MLVESVKSGLPNKSFLTTEFSFSAKMLVLIVFSLFNIVRFWVGEFVQWKKNWVIYSISFPQLHKGSTESWKLCLNLCSFKWLKPILRLFRNFNFSGLFMWKTLLEFGLMKFNKCFLKIFKEAELQISRSSLLQSLITYGKNLFLKKLCLILKGVMLFEFLVMCILLLLGIKLNKYRGDLLLSILKKRHSFLNQRKAS